MTIKTWQKRIAIITDTSYQGYIEAHEIDEAKQAEIDELRARLDAWEKQEPVAYKIHASKFANGQQLVFDKPEKLASYLTVTPLYTKPKEKP
ncbi:MAG: hypothetical protein KGI54_10525 [Pseudomonadota bacterium]|nr:hypothetical protein [Pseudomonadota bacterium]